ncbi:monocarboxylate transporter 10-like [Actinia tenebrosa]|uniref:Monocarboxylate transporter 10-like n=1 Tax=Actinia tenebrosa TaxID=6105 RepID=A0A6P8IQW8_ACTTE|nr:monocarboxylate transporter 10-like [Actinia tenebrosa]
MRQVAEKIAPSLVGSLALGAGLFLCVVTAKLCEKFNCRTVNRVGLISFVMGFALSSLCNSIYPLYITYSLLNGFAGSCTHTSNFILVRQYFKKRYSLAMGIVTAGAGIGMLSVGPLVQYLTDTLGWKNTFRVFAGIFGAFIPLTIVLDPNVESCEEVPIETVMQENSIEKDIKIKPRKIVLGFLDLSVWTFPEFTISVVAIFIGSWGHYTTLIHMIKYSEEVGISPTKSSTLLVFVGIATIVSRLVSGRLCDVSFIKPRYVHQLGIILSGISTILLTFAVNYTHLIIFSVFFGIADGAFRVTTNILFMNTVDIPRKPSAFGQANMITSFSNAAGPAIAGMMADKSGSYTSAFYMAGSVSIVAGAILFLHLCFFKDLTNRPREVALLVRDEPTSIEAGETSLDKMMTTC